RPTTAWPASTIVSHSRAIACGSRGGRRAVRGQCGVTRAADPFLLKRRWMTRSPSRTTTTRHILATIVFVALGAASSRAQTDTAQTLESRVCPWTNREPVRIPDSVEVQDELRGPMEAMLRKSATFQSQIRRIARAPRLYVRVRADPFLA